MGNNFSGNTELINVQLYFSCETLNTDLALCSQYLVPALLTFVEGWDLYLTSALLGLPQVENLPVNQNLRGSNIHFSCLYCVLISFRVF